MTVRVDNLTPVLDAAPGELVIGRVRVVNDGPDDATFRLRVVGLDGNGVVLEVPGGPVEAGSSADVDVPLDVPAALGVGHHAVALEVSSDRPDERSALVQLTVNIDSLQRVQMTPSPSTVRAGRNGRFTLDVVNHEQATVDVALAGEAADVLVRFDPPMLRLHPGERGWVRGRIRARQRWGGESVHHLLTLTARGRSSTTSTTMAYVQRPVFPGRARNAVAGLVVVALFLGAVGGGLWWYGQRDATEDATDETDRDGDGVLDPITGEPVSADGAGGDGSGGAGGSGGGSAGGESATGPGAIPTYTLVTGSVTTTDGDASGITVRMDTINLDPRTGEASPQGIAGRSRPISKHWSIRQSSRPSVITPIRQTESVSSIQTDAEGLWQFSGVPIRQNYEVVFAKPGYTTRSYVVSPPDDGSTVELDVELVPGDGRLAGTVFGPNGPLGGVDIDITDGTLVFRTTSASQASASGGVGSFALEGLSTPSVYTLTASADGFGNEVLQLPLAAGQTNEGVSITMRAGVGSISGRVTVGGESRGGVAVRASDGDVAFTTTSLTEGDIGSFSIPGLTIPGQYTVTAALDGFIPQTRRVDLAGNAGSVDFDLVPTTAGIAGRVFSSNGNPIVGAGVTVSVDEVSFRTATARDPIPGTFDITDLPPGTYLVRIARFDHLPFTQQVTVTAGQTVDLGDIVLEFTPRPPIAALGSISVRVEDAEGSPLTGSQVEIYALGAVVGEDPPLRTASDTSGDQFTFVFDNIPVGTYRVRGTRNIYRAANERVSVGLGRETVSLRLLRLGQASGQLVDAFTGAPLRNYEVAIYRVNSPTSETFIENRPVGPGADVDDRGRIPWQSSPNSLISGTYRLEITRPPPGYQLVPNQVIDPVVTTSPPSMRFVVPEDSEAPVETLDIKMAPYPLIGGRLFTPRLDQAGETSLVPFEAAAIEALAADGLEVELTCGENSALADLVPLAPRDAVRPSPNYTLPELGHHFEFTPFVVQQEQLLGACTLEVRAPGFVTAETELANPIAVSDGFTRTDRTVNVPVFEPVDPLFGTVFWRDGDDEIVVPDVEITSDDRAVTGGDATEGSDPATVPAPEPGRGVVDDTTDDNGDWTLAGQLFGRAVYTFDHPDFARGQIEVIITNVDETIVRPVGGDAAGAAVTRRTTDGGYDVELTNPGQGPLSGTVRIFTRRSSPAFDQVGRSATGPGSPLSDIAYVDEENPRRFSAGLVDAGTWTVTFVPPPAHDFFGGSVAVRSELVEPNRGFEAFDTELVELGTVQMAVDYRPTVGLDQPAGEDASGEASYDLETSAVTFPARTGVADDETFTALPVDPTDPVGVPVRYELDVTRAGFDELAASVSVTDVTPDPVDGPDAAISRTGSTDVPLDMKAGSVLSVAVDLPQYGSFSGTVLGRQGSTTIPPTVLRYDGADGGLEVTAVRVRRADGTVIAPDDFDAFADRVRVLAPPEGEFGVSFVVSGPPGYYDISVSHPFYRPTDPATIPIFGGPYDEDPLLQTPGRVLIENETAVGPFAGLEWALDVIPGNLELTVFDQLDFTSPVAGARVVVTRVGDGVELDAVLTGTDGVASFSSLPPDSYRVEIRRYAAEPPVVCPDPEIDYTCLPSQDLSFPVIIVVEIAEGADPARVVQVEAVLPSLLAAIQGTIIAVNTEYDPELDGPMGHADDRVAVPAPIRVERRYLAPSARISSDGNLAVVNEATDGDLVSNTRTWVRADAPAGTPPSSAFRFDDLPAGNHELTFSLDDEARSSPPGYRLLGGPGPAEVTVAATGTTTELVVYQAYDVELLVELEYPTVVSVRNPVVVLLDGSGEGAAVVGDAPVYLPADPERPNTVTVSITGVPPRAAAYQLRVTDDLAEPSDPDELSVIVVPNGDAAATTPPDAPVQVQSVAMSGNRANVTGTLQQVDPQGSSANDRNGNLQGPATIEIFPKGGTTRIDFATVATGGNTGTFEFEVGAGSYDVRVTKSGYFSSTATIDDVVLGQDNAMGVVSVRQQHVVTVSIAGAADDGTTVTVVPTETVPGRFTLGTRQGTVVDSNRVWDFNVEPGKQFRFRASRAGRFDMVFPSTSTALTAPVGRTTAYSGTLIGRIVDVAVDGPVSPSSDSPIAVTAVLSSGGATFSRSANAPVSPGTTTTPRFTSTDTTNAIPVAAPGSLTVSAPGFRTLVLPAPDPIPSDPTSTTWPVPGYASAAVDGGTAQTARTQSIPVTLRPNVTTITGVLTGTEAIATVSLFRNGTQVGTSEDSSGGATNAYTFTGTFEPGTYDVVVDQLGVGQGDGSVVITAVSPSGANATVDDIAIEVGAVTVTFAVSGPAASAVEVWVGNDPISVTAVPADTPTGVQFTRDEDEVAVAYEVRSAGRVWQTVTLAVGDITETGGALTATSSVALPVFPTFTGTVSDGGTGVADVTVVLRTGVCADDGAQLGTATSRAASTTPPPPPAIALGSYVGLTSTAGGRAGPACVSAVSGELEAAVDIAIPPASTTVNLALE